MYKTPVSGYTINRKNNRQQENLKNRQQKIHIELFPEKPKPPWTQNFLRPLMFLYAFWKSSFSQLRFGYFGIL